MPFSSTSALQGRLLLLLRCGSPLIPHPHQRAPAPDLGPALPAMPPLSDASTVFVGDLSRLASAADLSQLFGGVEQCSVKLCEPKGPSALAYAYITYPYPEAGELGAGRAQGEGRGRGARGAGPAQRRERLASGLALRCWLPCRLPRGEPAAGCSWFQIPATPSPPNLTVPAAPRPPPLPPPHRLPSRPLQQPPRRSAASIISPFAAAPSAYVAAAACAPERDSAVASGAKPAHQASLAPSLQVMHRVRTCLKRDGGGNVFVRGLAPGVGSAALQAAFEPFGGVLSAKVPTDPDSGKPRG